jgi:hypothetical protein
LVYDPPELFVQHHMHIEPRCLCWQTSQRLASSLATEPMRLVQQATEHSQLALRQSVVPAGRAGKGLRLGLTRCSRRRQRPCDAKQAVLHQLAGTLIADQMASERIFLSRVPDYLRLLLGFQPEEGLAVASTQANLERRWPLQVKFASVRLTKCPHREDFVEG